MTSIFSKNESKNLFGEDFNFDDTDDNITISEDSDNEQVKINNSKKLKHERLAKKHLKWNPN